MSKNKVYLGDGVYADYLVGQVVLTTEDGVSIKNIIFLEPEIVSALEDYLKSLRGRG